MHHSTRAYVGLFILSFLLVFSGCGGSLSRNAPRSSSDYSDTTNYEDTTNDENETEKIAYEPLSGHMDYVEFHINSDLAKNGLEIEKQSFEEGLNEKEFPELRSAFEVSSKKWLPRKKNSIPIVQNAEVNRWIRYFSGPIRSNFSRWIQRLSYYGPLLEDILKEYKLPPDLVYLAMIESGLNLNAYSHASAAGPWQFIRSTGRLYGLNSGDVVDERRDLIKSTRAAAKHLRDLYETYGDWYLAFAAYNAGAGKVNSAIKKSNTRNFWKMSGPRTKFLRQETKDYVPKILAAALITKNYSKYGFSKNLFQKPIDVESVSVPDATDVFVLAKCADVPVDTIKAMNPSLLMGVTPPNTKYDVLLPAEKANTFKKNYSRVPKSKRARYVFHKTRRSETLAKVAQEYQVSTNKLAKLNNLKTSTRLQAGKILLIPKKGKDLDQIFDIPYEPQTELAAMDPDGEDYSNTDTGASISSVVEDDLSNAVTPKDNLFETSYKKHLVQRGETLAVIAKKYGLKVSTLSQWNGLGKNNLIKVGQELRVSSAIAVAPKNEEEGEDPAVVLSRTETYRVQKGDTLGVIAKKHGVKITHLQQWNNLNSKAVIRAGQVLKVSAPQTPHVAEVTGNTNSTIEIVSAEPESQVVSSMRVGTEMDNVIIHRVRRGETLWDLSKKYKVTIHELKKWNDLNSDRLTLNQKLKIHASEMPSSKKPIAAI